MRSKEANKLINFRVPNDLRIAFDEVCYQQDLTRTQSLTRLMKKFIEEGSLETKRTRVAIETQLNHFETRQQLNLPVGFNSSNETGFISEDNWVSIEDDFLANNQRNF